MKNRVCLAVKRNQSNPDCAVTSNYTILFSHTDPGLLSSMVPSYLNVKAMARALRGHHINMTYGIITRKTLGGDTTQHN